MKLTVETTTEYDTIKGKAAVTFHTDSNGHGYVANVTEGRIHTILSSALQAIMLLAKEDDREYKSNG